MPARRTPHPALRGTPIGFAHRGFTPVRDGATGAHSWENTLEAFAQALKLGLNHLETDVRATADGVVVVHHDEDLSRTTGRSVSLAQVTWAELSEFSVAGRHPVPRLDEVLRTFPEAVFNIDVKESAVVGPLAEVIRHTNSEDRVLVASFDGRRARMVQSRAPGVARSAGMTASAGARLAAGLATASTRLGGALFARAVGGADALQLPEWAGRLRVVTPRLLNCAREAGVQVHVWTVDDPDDMDRLLDMGVDGLMSDRGDVLSEVLTRRAG